MTKGGSSGWLYGFGCGVCLVVAVVVGLRLVPGAKVGDVDPVSAVVALLALAAALWAGRHAVRIARIARIAPVPVMEVAARLADDVRSRESRARTQLLGNKNRTIDVDFAFRPAPAHPAQHAQAKGQLTQVVDYYQALRPQRLVITGAPGAGKTVLALELLLGLLETREPAQPVPVRIPATIWDTSHPLSDWLVQHLVAAYQQDSRTAQALVNAGLILPVIDGLDEVDAEDTPGHDSHAADVVRALNTYQHGRHAAPLVLTCRTGHYQALTGADVWTHDAALVAIDAVDAVKARAFIQSRVDNPARWRTVLSTIDDHPGGPLAVGLSTPWRLSLATVVYEQRNPDNSYTRDPATLIRVAASGNHAVREHLLAHFIAATTAHSVQSDKQTPYSAEQAHQWLAVLAGYLHHNATIGRIFGGGPLSGTELVLHQLWPLGGVNRVRGIVLAVTALTWLIAAVVLLIHNEIEPGRVLIFGFACAALGGCLWNDFVWGSIWPESTRIHTGRLRVDTRHLRTQKGRRSLLVGLAFGLMTMLTLKPAVELIFGLRYGLVFWLMLGLALGLVIGLSDKTENPQEHDAASVIWDPREIIKHDLATGLALGFTSGLMAGLGFWLAGGLLAGLASGVMLGIRFGQVGIHYLALLLFTRGWFGTPGLPWRLGRFLHWCYQVGLIRQAGIGYQFRHRELQDHLARHPQSVPVSG
ncbi:NACHT domain-containing protein [Lentzea sp. JNUCC 0626]|uniref:NACHT domain-containing protein n=1 Tax=Lentzea sp. JNUCC 0626 TaxID=3367513 RepID=UPI003749337A